MIEERVNRAIAEGAPSAATLTGHTLPMADEFRALLLATVLDGAAGTLNPPREF